MLGVRRHPGQAQNPPQVRHRSPSTTPDCPVPAGAGRRAGAGGGGGHRGQHQEQQKLPLVDHVVAKGGVGHSHIPSCFLTTSLSAQTCKSKHVTFHCLELHFFPADVSSDK